MVTSEPSVSSKGLFLIKLHTKKSKYFHEHYGEKQANSQTKKRKYNISQDLHFVGPIYCKETTQLTFTCSKSIIETLEKGVKYVQS